MLTTKYKKYSQFSCMPKSRIVNPSVEWITRQMNFQPKPPKQTNKQTNKQIDSHNITLLSMTYNLKPPIGEYLLKFQTEVILEN